MCEWHEATRGSASLVVLPVGDDSSRTVHTMNQGSPRKLARDNLYYLESATFLVRVKLSGLY